MHETGVLRALFPEWEQIECLVVRDFYHRYTVDEHTLVAIRILAELRPPRIRRDAVSRTCLRKWRTRRRCSSRCCSTTRERRSRTGRT